MSHKIENVKALYLEGIRDGNAREAVTKYTEDRYTQHSAGVADGVEGFVAFSFPRVYSLIVDFFKVLMRSLR